MNNKLLIPVVLVVCLVSIASIVANAQSPQSSGRFQLMTAEVGSPQPQPTVFLLDTATGQVWKYDIGVGAMHQLKTKDQGRSTTGAIAAVSSGSFIPVPRIEYEGGLDNGQPPRK
jgi:hypothetical protein